MLERKASAIEPAGYLLSGNSKASVGMFAAQRFQFMGCKINNQQAPLGMKHAARFNQGATGFVKVMQDLMDDHQISGAIGLGQGIDFTLPNLSMAKGVLFQI